jgi:hypothetical protein
MQKMNGKEFNIKAFFKKPKEAMANLRILQGQLEKVEKKKGPINIKVIEELQKDPEMPGLGGLMKDWEKYDNLPDEVKKTVIQEYITLMKTISGGQVDARIAQKIAAADPKKKGWVNAYYNTEAGREQIYEEIAREEVWQATKQNIANNKGGKTPTPVTPAARKNQELDPLLKRAKFIADAGIKETGGLPELKRITDGNGITKFSGVVQQLMRGLGKGAKGGFNREFISWLEGMDEAARKTYMTVKNGVVELTEKGKKAKEVFNENTFREFGVAQTTAAQDALAQKAAFVRLTNAGYDTATALEMVSDANLAVSINSEALTTVEFEAVR